MNWKANSYNTEQALNLPMEHIGLSYLGKKKDSGVGVYEQETTTLTYDKHMFGDGHIIILSLSYTDIFRGLHMLAADQKQ